MAATDSQELYALWVEVTTCSCWQSVEWCWCDHGYQGCPRLNSIAVSQSTNSIRWQDPNNYSDTEMRALSRLGGLEEDSSESLDGGSILKRSEKSSKTGWRVGRTRLSPKVEGSCLSFTWFRVLTFQIIMKVFNWMKCSIIEKKKHHTMCCAW